MKPPKAIINACQVLRRRVRYKDAGLQLPATPSGSDDTAVIREATRLFTESWIVPILDYIEQGNMGRLAEFVAGYRGEPMDDPGCPAG